MSDTVLDDICVNGIRNLDLYIYKVMSRVSRTEYIVAVNVSELFLSGSIIYFR
jgi:hypothetical protein